MANAKPKMQNPLTTRQVAEALQVSESSVKRWCDRGVIPTVRTAGGHRRIPLAGFMRYLEETNQRVVSPVLPGAGATAAAGSLATGGASTGAARDNPQGSLQDLQIAFREALAQGDEQRCREILISWYGRGESMPGVSDDLIASSFHELGDHWQHGDIEVYQERRGCEICNRLIHELSRMLPAPPPNAPLAIGGTPAGDQYTTPTRLIELVLREAGWQAMNLGSNLPLETIRSAVLDHRPRMLWLSISHLENEQRFVEDYTEFYRGLPASLTVVIGGQALHDGLRPQLGYTGFCDNLRQLHAFATALLQRRQTVDASNN